MAKTTNKESTANSSTCKKCKSTLGSSETQSSDPMDSTKDIECKSREEFEGPREPESLFVNDSRQAQGRKSSRKEAMIDEKVEEIVSIQMAAVLKAIAKLIEFKVECCEIESDKLLRLKRYENDKHLVLQKAKMFGWPEERVNEEWKKIDKELEAEQVV